MPHYRVYDIKWTPPPEAPADSFDFASEGGEAEAAVPFHRIIDNTLYGSRTPTGDAAEADNTWSLPTNGQDILLGGAGNDTLYLQDGAAEAEEPVVVRIVGDSGGDGMLAEGYWPRLSEEVVIPTETDPGLF